MKCIECQNEMQEKDFYKCSICYKCIYKEKMNPKRRKKVKVDVICRECPQVVRKPRRLFCSDECARVNKNKSNKAYWTNNLQFQRVGFKIDATQIKNRDVNFL